ncbi:MAG: alpha/beta fold hydrolase [Actinomycetota bacterium]
MSASSLRPRRFRHPALPDVEVWIAGEGKPIVLLPGWGLNGLAYRQSMKEMASLGRRVIAPTLTVAEATRWSLAAIASIAAQAAETYDADPAPVIGHSFGGAAAMAFAAEHPDMVASLVLVDAVGVSPGRMKLARLALPGRAWLVGMNADAALSFMRGAMTQGGIASMIGAARWILNQSLSDQIEAIKKHDTPRTMVWAESDTVLPLSAGKQLARILDCGLHIIRQTRSWPTDRKPDHDWPMRAPKLFAERMLHHIALLEAPRPRSVNIK